MREAIPKEERCRSANWERAARKEQLDGKAADWMEQVSDEQYKA